MTRTWQMQVAKNKLSEVVDRAETEGPQMISRHGETVAVVLSYETYAQLTRPRGDLVDFLRRSPLRGVELDLERSHDTGRDVDHDLAD